MSPISHTHHLSFSGMTIRLANLLIPGVSPLQTILVVVTKVTMGSPAPEQKQCREKQSWRVLFKGSQSIRAKATEEPQHTNKNMTLGLVRKQPGLVSEGRRKQRELSSDQTDKKNSHNDPEDCSFQE